METGSRDSTAVTTSRPILATKLYRPRIRRQTVARPRLLETLDLGIEGRVTLVSAPAGFGKSTLLGAWLTDLSSREQSAHAAAWLSLDSGDNDPASFWKYVIAALRTIAEDIGDAALEALDTPGSPSPHSLLTGLLNDLAGLEQEIVLVIDDYHLIESQEVHGGVSYLIDHMPPNFHLVLASRSDPPLPFARLRARGELVEIRASGLRFSVDEAAEYLTRAMELELTPSDVATLGERTEGWIAALQLAALSMRGRDDLADFVAGFAGDDRYVVDYLAEEVLQNQPTELRAFLLQTSILTRMSAALVETVTGRPDGGAMLEALDRANLFLVPLDDRRRWFRYHHLFAEVLQARLVEEQPEQLLDLHRRASSWYAQRGDLDDAIHHALTAPDHDLAAQLIEEAMPTMARDRREATLRTWMEALPAEAFRSRPVLSLGFAGALLSTGQTEGVEARLRDAERWVDAPPSAEVNEGLPVAVDENEFRRLPGAVAIYRSGLALAQGDATATLHHARRALGLLDADDDYRRGAAAALEGLALWGRGDLEGAYQGYASSVASFRRSGHIADMLGCTVTLADLRLTQGRLQDALSSYETALGLALAQPSQVRRGIPDMHVGIATILCERGELEAAATHLDQALVLGDSAGLPKYRYRSRLAMAQLRQAHGDLAGAIELVDEAEQFFVTDMAPLARPVPATRARLWVSQGRVADAVAWAQEAGLSPDDELSYVREYEHVTLARILIAQHRRSGDRHHRVDALSFLARLCGAAEMGGRTGSVIEILVLQSLAHRAEGDMRAAVASLEKALQLVDGEGYTRVFLDEGSALTSLLEAVTTDDVREIASRLLRMTRGDERAPAAVAHGAGLPEPLSEREREVLRLLATEMSGPEIARLLVVSVNTLRTHTKRIYTKLDVNNRRSAVLRAQELGELPGR